MVFRSSICNIFCTLALIALGSSNLSAANKPPKSVKVYVFDCGSIKGLSTTMFDLKPEQVTATGFVVPCYLIVHPKGAMMWDVGVIPDSAFKADGAPVTQGISTVNKPLLPQLAALGYTPADIKYLALSHYHSDHDANANAFAGATWLVRKEDRDVMFADKPAGIIQPAHYSELRNAHTIIIDKDDYDVFGDGTVVIKSAPGHTPGHQVLFLKLKKTGPLVIAGDLYHYPEEKTYNKFPSFEFNKEQSAVSRKKIDEFVEKNHAQMWIEHDQATFDKLKKAPEFYE